MKSKWFTGARTIIAATMATVVIGSAALPALAQRPGNGGPGERPPHVQPGQQGRPVGERPGNGRPQQGRHDAQQEIVAQALGMSVEELRTALQGGQTVADLAAANGIALDTIVDAVLAERKAQLDQAVADGSLTQEEADAKLSEMREQVTKRLSEPFAGRPVNGGGRPQQGGHGAQQEIIAQALGMSVEELRTAVQGGQTVADLAAANGIALDTIVDAVLAERKAQLDQAVADGSLTQEEADAKLSAMREQVTKRLSEPFAGRPGSEAAPTTNDATAQGAENTGFINAVVSLFLPLVTQ
jgi:polyhydroxyalkanoate synthesis regulator phasin